MCRAELAVTPGVDDARGLRFEPVAFSMDAFFPPRTRVICQVSIAQLRGSDGRPRSARGNRNNSNNNNTEGWRTSASLEKTQVPPKPTGGVALLFDLIFFILPLSQGLSLGRVSRQRSSLRVQPVKKRPFQGTCLGSITQPPPPTAAMVQDPRNTFNTLHVVKVERVLDSYFPMQNSSSMLETGLIWQELANWKVKPPSP